MQNKHSSIRKRNSGLRNTYRLAIKELKEILRDRRTIITLVGMPLLIYPLLSILFQKFYFSAANAKQKTAYEYVLDEQYLDAEGDVVEQTGARKRLSDEKLIELFAANYVNLGEAYLFPELEFPAKSLVQPLTKGDTDPLFVSQNEHPYFSDNKLTLRNPDGDSLEEIIKSGEADVGIRLNRIRGRPPFVELIQRDSGISARAANYLRKRIDATNFVLTKMAIAGARQKLLYKQSRYQLVKVDGETTVAAISMSSLVPLILILMTVTGAVYPAIDLTAGERERGTLEALIAAPVPRFQVLFAKFIGVLTVAMLTAVVNMTGMFSTLALFGLLPILFGENSFSLLAIIQVFALLLLFAGFFSSVLLAVTSFARSFKEAQAYIVPLMLLSITPGIVSLTPGLELAGVLSVVPLINIVLLAREIMDGTATAIPAIIAITSTTLYGISALSLAASIFGSDSILYGNQTSWRSLIRRAPLPTDEISISRSLSCLAVIFPISFLSIGLVGRVPQMVADNQGIDVEQVGYWTSLLPFVISTILVFVVVPFLFLWHGRISVIGSLKLRTGNPMGYVAAIMIGVCMWPLIGQLVEFLNDSMARMSGETDEPVWKQELLEKAKEIVQKWRTVSPIIIVGCFSLIPAVCEEFFFRGVLLRSIAAKNKIWVAIFLSALTFGVFHTLSLTDLSSQKFLPSFLAGIVLAWLAIKSGSLVPGIILHTLNNGILVSVAYYEDRLVANGWIEKDQSGFPVWMLVVAGIGLLAGLVVVLLMKKESDPIESS